MDLHARKVWAFLIDLLIFHLGYWTVFDHILDPLCQNTYLMVTCSIRYLSIWLSLLGIYVWLRHFFCSASIGEVLMKLSHFDAKNGKKVAFFKLWFRSKMLLLFGVMNSVAFSYFIFEDRIQNEIFERLKFIWLLLYFVLSTVLVIQALSKKSADRCSYPLRKK